MTDPVATEEQGHLSDVRAGTILRHKSGGHVTIDRRKDEGGGWWNTDGSGFADSAIDSGDWTVVGQDGQRAQRAEEAEVARMLAVMHGMGPGATNFWPAAVAIVKERDNLRRHGHLGPRMGL